MTVENGFSIRETEALKREIFASLHCALPGIVESYDPETQTATVQPAVKSRPLYRSGQGEEAAAVAFPLLHDVPVFMPVSFEVNPGDLCLLVFADCDIDRWLETGETEEPVSGRMHSLSDAFAFVGFGVRRGDDGGGAAD